jgi:hypothetical protein
MRRQPSPRARSSEAGASRPSAGAARPSRARTPLLAPTHYALARHRPSRGLWVFALQAQTLIGVCGPLEGDPPPAWLLPHFDFASPDARTHLPLVRARLAGFDRLA